MQILNRLVILFALILTSCGKDGAPNTAVSENLFLQLSTQNVETNLSTDLLGLWESESYSEEGWIYTLRWEITETSTTLAKRCTNAAGKSWYVQVSLDFEKSAVVQRSTIDPYSIPVTSEKKSAITLMTQHKPCRVAIDPSNASTQSLIASDTTEFAALSQDDHESGSMTLTTAGSPAEVVTLTKIQNR